MAEQITIYTTSWCPYCQRAKQLLDGKNAAYTEIDIEQVDGSRDTMQERSGQTSVPQIWIGERHIGGCDDLHALNETGDLDSLL